MAWSQPFDSHQEYNELQTDQNPLLYVVSAAAVFLAYVLHLGFAPALFLGRLANLLLFAALAALAVKVAPFGKRVFTVAALLPMTLHLAASFSRDAPLLGLCFAFTALLLDAAFGPEKQKALSPARLALLLGCGVLLAPGKLVYLPLAALLLVVPAARLGRHAKAKKCGYLAICLALALLLNTGLLADTLHSGAGEQTETSETTETTAEAANIEDTDRTPKGRPEERDADYEVEICTVNTTENFLRRLYYFIDNTRDPAQSELDFWVQALNDGDVTPAVLEQSFFLSPEHINEYNDSSDFYWNVCSALLGTNVSYGNEDAFYPYFEQGGPVLAYKQLLGLDSTQTYFAELGLEVGSMDDRIPLDRAELAKEVEAARATRSTQSTADEADKTTYTPGYILRHPVATVMLFVRSAVENGDHYIRTLVGGSLSYYTVDLAWGWVVVLYLLLAYAALPVQGAALAPCGKARGWCCAATVVSCLLAVAGCLLWTPTHYETLYGLQGRYFLPVLPLLLLTCLPRRLAAVPDEDTAQSHLILALALVQAGVVVNIMLAVIAR